MTVIIPLNLKLCFRSLCQCFRCLSYSTDRRDGRRIRTQRGKSSKFQRATILPCSMSTSSGRKTSIHCFHISLNFFFSLFPIWGSMHQVFNLHVLRSCASSIFTPFFFMYFLIIPIFRCPPTSVFSLLHLLQLFYPHGPTISVSLL